MEKLCGHRNNPNRRAAILPLIMISILLTAQAPVPEPVTDTETELGLAVYKELKTKGEIIATSPLYAHGRVTFEDVAGVDEAK